MENTTGKRDPGNQSDILGDKKAAMVSQENQSHMQERKAKKQCDKEKLSEIILAPCSTVACHR
jgi:hypothetical protein